jgi:Holliday junction resolvase RusA-like endonuclease
MEFKITIDKSVILCYNKWYFEKYPKRKVLPIKKPIPPSLNAFTAMKRMVQNSLKQKYKEFSVWLASHYEIADLNISKAEFTYEFFFPDHRRRDFDNLLLTPKLINDGLVEAKTLVDDDGEKLMLKFKPFQYDKSNPRVEISVKGE